jgi:hypothetical protein
VDGRGDFGVGYATHSQHKRVAGALGEAVLCQARAKAVRGRTLAAQSPAIFGARGASSLRPRIGAAFGARGSATLVAQVAGTTRTTERKILKRRCSEKGVVRRPGWTKARAARACGTCECRPR